MRTWSKKRLKLVKLPVLLLSVLWLSACKVSKGTVALSPPVDLPRQKTEIVRETTSIDTMYSVPVTVQLAYATAYSRLENAWSISSARIDSLGQLVHSLENKELMPGKVIKQKEKKVDSVPVPYPVPYAVPGPETVKYVKQQDFFWHTGLVVIITASLAAVFGLIVIIRKLKKK